MTTTSVAPDWLVPGAEVLVIRHGTHTKRTYRSTVNTVANQSFTVHGQKGRFNIRTLRRTEGKGVWSAVDFQVVPVDSDEGRDRLARLRRERLVKDADDAIERWRRARNAESEPLRTLIEALQAIDTGEAEK